MIFIGLGIFQFMTASFVAIGVIIARLMLKKVPKIFSYALWSAVLIRLVFPVSFTSTFSFLSVIKPGPQQRGEEVVRAIRNRMPDFSLTGDPRNKERVITETFSTGITLGLFSDAFPIKYKNKSKVEFGVTKSELGRMVDLFKRLSDFNPPVHNATDFFNDLLGIQAISL